MKWKKEANDKWVLWKDGTQISTVYQTWSGDQIIYTERETGRWAWELSDLQEAIENGFNKLEQ